MDLLVVRHAKSMSRDEFAKTGKDDWLRPISEKGRSEMKQVAPVIRQLVPEVDRFVSSPLTRAQQTRELISEVYESAEFVETETLAPTAEPTNFQEWLSNNLSGGTVAIFGHKPSLPAIVSYLLSGNDDSFVDLKKGSAALLELEDLTEQAPGDLQWLLSPDQLLKMR